MSSRLMTIVHLLLLCLVWSAARAQEWNIQVVDDAGDAGYYSQIVSLSDGTPCIAYKVSNTMRLARWVEEGGESGWVFRTLATGVYGRNLKMLVDDSDHLQLVWTSSSTVVYGIWDIGLNDWILSPQSTGVSGSAWNLDLTLFADGDDRIPFVAFADDGNAVRVGTRDPGTGTWSNEPISDTSHPSYGAASIAVDSTGGRHVSFCEYVSGEYNLMYAVKVAGGENWMLQTVDSGGAANVGEYSSILLDASDVVHIVYYDRTNRDLKYATPVVP